MCFGGSGGNQGGSGSQEDAEVRRSHSKAGISAAETRRYFRERDNPAHSRNENAPGASTSVSHSRDEGGNLVSQRVEYGQGNFSDGSMKAENILGKRDDVFSVGNDLSVGGKIFSNARLSKSGNSIISTDPNNVGTIGGITSGGGLWGGREVQSALGVGAQDSRGIATGLVTPRLAAQNLSRTEKYQETSNQFAGKTPAEIAAIRSANRSRNPLDRDGDGNILTSTDSMGRVYGIGTTGDGSGAQPAIYDPTLPEAYRGIPQLDPNRASDPNLTMFGKGMRTASRFVPYVGALDLADKKGFIPDVLKGNTGRGTDIGSLEDLKTTPSGEITRGDNFTYAPTRFATSNESARNPFGAFGRTGGIEPEASFQQKNPMGALTATSNLRPQLRPDMSGINTSTLTQANKGETIMVDGFPKSYAKKVPISTYFRMDDDPDPDLNFPQVMPPVNNDDEQSIYDRFNYRKYVPSDPTLIAQSSYGGKFGSGQPNYMGSGLPTGIYSDGMAGATVLTPFFNPITGEYFNAPASNYYAEEGSNWRRGTPTEAYNLPIVA